MISFLPGIPSDCFDKSQLREWLPVVGAAWVPHVRVIRRTPIITQIDSQAAIAINQIVVNENSNRRIGAIRQTHAISLIERYTVIFDQHVGGILIHENAAFLIVQVLSPRNIGSDKIPH